jgi:hypothetical protein
MLACSKECPGSLNFGSSTNIEDKKETVYNLVLFDLLGVIQ